MSVIVQDAISPDLSRIIQQCKNPRAALEAIGLALVSLTFRAFTDPSLRPTPWAPVKHSGAPLYRSGALKHSIRVTAVTNESVKVGTDRFYGIFHQLGTRKSGKHPGLPPRPFFPFYPSGGMTAAARQRLDAAARAAVDGMMKP